ncbi:MAG: hypothetical protein KY455_10215 [Euryarchaeota archaeon]|nr:hypothetical protein [Euryarchaeota archaeon]
MPESITGEQRDKTVALRKEGKKYREIEAETGLSQMTIAKVLREAGMTRKSSTTAETAEPDPSTSGTDLTPRPGSEAIRELTPAAAPAAPNQAKAPTKGERPDPNQVFTCTKCGTDFREWDGEEPCPACGGTP